MAMPDDQTAALDETTSTIVVTPEPRKRRRAPIVIGVIVAVLILLVVAFVLVDNWARQQVSDLVTDKVHEVLDSDQPVDVTVVGVSVLAQAITGSLDRVDVSVDNVTIGELTGDVTLVATSIPIDLSKPVKNVDISFTTDEASVQSLVDLASDSSIGAVELVDGEIRFGSEFEVFGFPITIGVAVVPEAEDGQIAFTPSSVEVNGATLTAEDVESNFGSLADGLLEKRTVCIADRLPAPLVLTDLQVTDSTIVLSLTAKNVVLDEASLSQLGTC